MPGIQCTLVLVFQPLSLSYVSFPKTVPSNTFIFSIKDLCAGPKVESAQNWKRVRSFHFWVSTKLETAAVSTFGLDPKLETQLPDPKVETSLEFMIIQMFCILVNFEVLDLGNFDLK